MTLGVRWDGWMDLRLLWSFEVFREFLTLRFLYGDEACFGSCRTDKADLLSLDG